ncbi:PREDICTED: uncharacterized protein LOC105116714 [Populus euphratica]|uniref:Uncharacterized protein LOC105107355 n=1 Tax=Populus euphratica TaxID=75702 RepID=A0AAJ6TKE9_POPEU|nr:PREDICTED: uncharacterized protein LOC105107355 [Populus euphratica]XP_011012474.1 PREDICTED: uncharacterized protein LOC105116714 [Populus euphratica]
MAKNFGFLVCLLIMALDVVAGILGIEAEMAQNKVKHLKMWIFECRDPSHQAFKLGLAAVILLALAHTVATLLGGCTCMCSKEEFNKASANKQLAVASLFFSWIILAIGFSLLIIGTLANSKSRKLCGISHNRVLSIGGILCFVHGLFTVSYYVSATATARDNSRHHDRHATQA